MWIDNIRINMHVYIYIYIYIYNIHANRFLKHYFNIISTALQNIQLQVKLLPRMQEKAPFLKFVSWGACPRPLERRAQLRRPQIYRFSVTIGWHVCILLLLLFYLYSYTYIKYHFSFYTILVVEIYLFFASHLYHLCMKYLK